MKIEISIEDKYRIVKGAVIGLVALLGFFIVILGAMDTKVAGYRVDINYMTPRLEYCEEVRDKLTGVLEVRP
jgi:hypothetical protein